MTVQDLQEAYPDFVIKVQVYDESHAGEYILDDNPELAERKVEGVTDFDTSFLNIISCYC